MSRKSFSPNYTSAIVIVHGESEEIIAKHIKSSLRLNIYIHKGSTSIQINGLLKELDNHFKNLPKLTSNGKLSLNIKSRKLLNFKIFTIMDTDDCLETTKKSYINGDYFKEYALKDYIVPIYSNPDLEHALLKSHLIPKIYKSSEKVREYGKLFPIRNVPINESQLPLADMEKACEMLKANNTTNLDVFLKYCIDQAKKKRLKK